MTERGAAEFPSISIGIPVPNLTEALAWYSKLLPNRKTNHPVPHIFEFELVRSAWLQLVEEQASVGGVNVKFGVKDIQMEKERLASAGIVVGEIIHIPNVVSLCRFEDPYGNRLSLYEEH